jgi:hypothetical protein
MAAEGGIWRMLANILGHLQFPSLIASKGGRTLCTFSAREMCAEIHRSISSPPDVEDLSVKFTRVPSPYASELKRQVFEDANVVEGQLLQSGPQSVDPQLSAVVSQLPAVDTQPSAVVSQPSAGSPPSAVSPPPAVDSPPPAVETQPSAVDTQPSKSNLGKRKVDKTTGLTITFSWIFI